MSKEGSNEKDIPILKSTEENKSSLELPPSPSIYIDIDQLLKLSETIKNISLAHEISINEDFRIERQRSCSENSIEKRVREIMLQAFWDVLKQQLDSEPPVYTQAILLLEEVKEILLGILPPHNLRLRKQIEEQFNLDHVNDRLEHIGFLDFKSYTRYLIDTMAKMCAPVRDSEVISLKELILSSSFATDDIVTIYKRLFDVLENMRMDMANYTIAKMRPFIQKNAVEYERAKFQEYIISQKEIGIDGLQITKRWLKQTYECLKIKSDSSECSQISPFNIIIAASVEILFDWHADKVFPETVQIDEIRLRSISEFLQKMMLVASVVLVTLNSLSTPISIISNFPLLQCTSLGLNLKTQLKENLLTILKDIRPSEISNNADMLSCRVFADVEQTLLKQKEASKIPEFISLSSVELTPQILQELNGILHKQICDICNQTNPVCQLMNQRMRNFIHSTCFPISTTEKQKIPSGFALFEKEIQQNCFIIMKLFSFNRNVFGPIYAEIIQSLINKTDVDLDDEKSFLFEPSTSESR